MLLTAHFEAYLRDVNEQAVTAVNACRPTSSVLGQRLRLRHSKPTIDSIAGTQWDNRAAALESFVANEGWLWEPARTGSLDHARLVEGVTSPMPEDLRAYYRLWGIDDVFRSITRKASTRSRFWLAVRDLVDKRHAIAHGDPTAEATKQDVVRYLEVAEAFCRRADRLLERHLRRELRIAFI